MLGNWVVCGNGKGVWGRQAVWGGGTPWGLCGKGEGGEGAKGWWAGYVAMWVMCVGHVALCGMVNTVVNGQCEMEQRYNWHRAM